MNTKQRFLSRVITDVMVRNVVEGSPMAAELATSSRRERIRAATVEEIKQTALDLMREQQTTDIRFTDIARTMGMTAPALYRYFSDRDELLTHLITDTFADLGASIAAARDDVPEQDIGGRWLAAASAYRDWARSRPQQFALVLGMPVPGYSAPEEGTTTQAAKQAMGELEKLFMSAAASGRLRKPLVRDVSAAVAAGAQSKHSHLEGVLPPETFQAMLQAWASLHGFTVLESHGHFDWLEPAARDALFFSHVHMIATASGLPAPKSGYSQLEANRRGAAGS
jgi:AcrR family transcriptional regulator